MSTPKPKRAPLQRALRELRTRLGHTQESFSRELGVSLPTVGMWEYSGRLPLDIGLARLADIARQAGHDDLVKVFMGGLEELRQDRAHRASEIFDEIERWQKISAALTALDEIDAAVRSATSLKDAKAAVAPMAALLTELGTVLVAAKKWSWRNR